MAALTWCTCLLLLCASATRGSRDIDVGRLADLQSDLVRQTFGVIDEAIEAQYQMFDERIDALEARVAELERIIAEGVPANNPPEPDIPHTIPTRKPEPEPEPEPETEPEPAPTTAAPTTVPPTIRTSPPTQRPPVVVADPETCQDLYDRGESANGMYMIDPKGLGRPFEVMCNFDGSEAQTMVHHDSETEVKNNGNKSPGSFELVPVYNNADTDQLAALVEVSTSCQQFVKIRCKAAVLFEKKGVDYGWWISREGDTMKSWGGVPASMTSQECACNVAGNCAGGNSCNCDAAGKSETSDEGLLTDKEYLPVQGVYLGDTGGRKQTSWLTLGELVCFGKM